MNEYQNYYNPKIYREETEYTKHQSIFAAISLAVGYFFMRFVFASTLGLSASVFTILFLLFGVSYFMMTKKTGKVSVLLLLVILAFNLNFFLLDNGFIKFLNLLFVAVLSVYFLFCLSGKREQKKISDMFLFDLFKSLLVLPFSSFSKAPAAIINGGKKSGIAKKILLILVSLAVALPLTGIILSLLLSADGAFRTLFNRIFATALDDIVQNFFLAVFGIPVALYFFGFLYSSENGIHEDSFTEEKNRALLKSFRIAPAIIGITAVIPVILLYILFFVSQLAYFTSAFGNLVPDGFIPSEYARTGFFQICVVAFLNGVIIAAMGLTAKRKETGLSAVFKVFIGILSLLTLLFIATAISKMVLYINFFGLTPLRVYVTWFLCLLTAIFVIALLKQIFKKVNVVKSILVAFTLLFALLSFSNVDALIANYNVKQYQNGNLKEVDFQMMYRLSDAAIPYIVPLTKDKNKEIEEKAKKYVEAKKRTVLRDSDFYSLNLDTIRAKKLLSEK